MLNSFLTEVTAQFRILSIRFRKLFHKHRYDIPGAEEIKVSLTGGRHTAFMILKCKCGDKVPFPEDNFKLALDYGTEETKKFLSEVGLC